MPDLKKLVHEIHRRSLWQVIGIYLVGSWIALQVVDVLAQNFGLPEWFPAFALGLLVLGLPIVVATAFVQEGIGKGRGAETSDSVPAERAEAGPAYVPPAASGSTGLFTWRNAILGGIGALALWGAIAAGWMAFGWSDVVADGSTGAVDLEGARDAAAAQRTDLRSIAVLPFATRSEELADEYFSEGMHDDLLTQLSKIDSLTVISRTSVMQYAETTMTISEIASELGVATVLEGGIQRAGERVRVNVQLIEAASDRHLWAETYDEELSAANIFAIQTDLATKIAGALQATLTPDVAERLETVPTESIEAYELYTRARYAWETRGVVGNDIEEVLGLFTTALAADSSFAPSWLGVANTYLSAWNWGRMEREEAHPRARAALERALELDPALAEAHVTHARLLSFEQEVEQAHAAVTRALELNPGSADAHARHAHILEAQGRYDESIAESMRAIELDPLSISYRNLLADRLYYASRFDQSIDASRRVLEMEPNDWYAWYNVGWAAAVAGLTDEAIDAFHRSYEHAGDNRSSAKLGLAYAFARAGEADSTRFHLEGADPQSYDTALALFEVGDADEAFEALEIALEAGPGQFVRLDRDPAGEAMRQDPRYAALAERFGTN